MSDPTKANIWVDGVRRVFGGTTCRYEQRRGDDPCGQPAVTHVLLVPDDVTVLLCVEHLRWWVSVADRAYETHAFGPNCTMPGTLWFRDPLGESFCAPATSDGTLAAVEQTEPVPTECHSPV